ncbi:hypothetical protein LTR27_008392 [Elasticomyces elasticus]|nr:hypothetical protein LTR27_008392 [Elasticomyces elasticus]
MNSISSHDEQPPNFNIDPRAGDSLNLTLYVGIHDLGRRDSTDQLGIVVTMDTTFLEFKDMVEECYLRHWLPGACYAYYSSMRWDATFGGRVIDKNVARLWRWTQDHIAAQRDLVEPNHEFQNYCVLQTITRPLNSCETEAEAYQCEWYVRQGCPTHQDLTAIRLPVPPPPARRKSKGWDRRVGSASDWPRTCIALVPDVIVWAALGADWFEDETETKVEQETTRTFRQRVKGVLRRVFGAKRREQTSSCVETERQDERRPA